MTVTLYGSPLSLYTGRVRSYFIKAAVAYREVPPVTQHYEESVLMQAGGRRSMPTVELENGVAIRDSVAIVDHFEADLGFPFTPATPKHQAVSLLLDVIGAEGLLRPAMHYRWRYPENEPRLRFDFEQITPRNAPHDLTVEGRLERLRHASTALGASPENVDLVEALYMGLLERLHAHFATVPYFLGGRPCIGDFGMIAPLYAHLGRDIKPLSLMHEHAPWALRWVERMNRPGLDVGDYEPLCEDYLAGDEVPQTLLDVLRHLALDFVPETLAVCEATNVWIEANPHVVTGTPVERAIGEAHFTVEIRSMSAAAQPFRLYLLKRLQDHVDACSETDRADVVDMLASARMVDLLDARLDRDIGRAGNLEVWL